MKDIHDTMSLSLGNEIKPVIEQTKLTKDDILTDLEPSFKRGCDFSLKIVEQSLSDLDINEPMKKEIVEKIRNKLDKANSTEQKRLNYFQ